MRQERKLEKAIQRDGAQTQSDILEELKRRYPQYTKQESNKQPAIKKRRIAVFSSLAAVAACLAIILPCALLLPNRSPHGGGSDIYYCSAEEYKVIPSKYTLAEYSKKYNGSILYFKWYETVEEPSTNSFVRISDDKILCVQESAYNPETDEVIMISVTKVGVYLDEFDIDIQNCKSKRIVTDTLVKWNKDIDYSICIFENNGYRYFLQIEAGQDENRLFALVDELLQKK